MKQNIFILLIVSVMFISGCSPAAVNIPSVSESAQTNIPTILPENSPFVSPTIKPASTQVGSEDTILPLSTPWYDWQKEGVNTLDLEMGGCLTGDDKYMYFIPDYNVDNPTNNLYKANLDGSGRTLLDKGCNGNLIIENNTLYYLKDDGIYSINTDSLEKAEVIKGRIDGFYIYNKCIYIMPDNKNWKIISKDLKIKSLSNNYYKDEADYFFSGEFLYYLDNSGGGDVATVYSYNLESGEKKEIMNLSGIPVIYDGVIYYWNENDYIEAYNISERKSKKLSAPETGIPYLMALYNNYLINFSEDCVYDTKTGDNFLFEDIDDVDAIYSTPVAAYALLDDGWYRLDISDKKLILEPLKN